MFDTDEELEMLYTLSVNLEYFAQETERGSKYFSGDKAENYKNITKLLKMTSSLIRETMEIKE